MEELPDVQEIQETLAVIEVRDPDATTVQRFDSDHNVLVDMQDRIGRMLTRVLPAKYKKDDLRALLDRIENAIVDNRSKRKAAAYRSQ